MKRAITTLLLLVSFFSSVTAQKLSEESQISLLTISPGTELWSFAGHTAIRVMDPRLDLDVNFNYGVFDFRKENFYFKFLRGTLPYEIGAFNFRQETPYWIQEERVVTQQVLNLNLEQRQKMFDFLMNNYLPENREYRYLFFYDNCSTRVRDVLEEVVGDSLKFSTSLNADSTFREWIKIYSQKSKNYWSEFGMDLLIGIPSDEVTNSYRAMYIPDNLMNAFDSAQVYKDGNWQPLVSRKYDLNSTSKVPESLPVKPFTLFSILFLGLLYMSYMESQKGKWFILIDKILFTITGVCGILFFLLWFFTDHGVTSWNLNILWAIPILFPMALFLKRQESQPFLNQLFFVQMISAAFLLIGFKFLPQTFNTAIIPIVGIVLMRSYLIWKRKS